MAISDSSYKYFLLKKFIKDLMTCKNKWTFSFLKKIVLFFRKKIIKMPLFSSTSVYNPLRGASPVYGSKNRYFFSSLFDCICIQKYVCKISGRNSKNCGSHEFFCHVMFDLRILELKTLNAFFSKPWFSNWRAR